MGLWESIIIVTLFSIGVIVMDEIIHARRRKRREREGAARLGGGAARAERQRQEHADARADRLLPAHRRPGVHRRDGRRRAARRRPAAHRLSPRAGVPLSRAHGAPLPGLRGRGEGPRRARAPRGGGGRHRALRAPRGGRPPGRQALQGVPAAGRPGAGPGGRRGRPRAGRADRRPRPDADGRDAHPAAHARRPDDAPLDAHPHRGERALLAHRDPLARPPGRDRHAGRAGAAPGGGRAAPGARGRAGRRGRGRARRAARGRAGGARRARRPARRPLRALRARSRARAARARRRDGGARLDPPRAARQRAQPGGPLRPAGWAGGRRGRRAPGLARAELRRALPQGAALLLRLAARLPGHGRLPRLHRLLLPLRPRLLHHLRLRPEHHGELLADPLHRHPPGADLRHSSAHHAPPRRGAATRYARAPPHLSARRPRHRGREAGRLPGGDRRAARRNARLSRLGVPRAALLRGAAHRRVPGARPLLAGVRVVRPLRLLAHRQPGAGGLLHRAAAPAPLAALVDRGSHRGRDPPPGARHLALQPLPALLGRAGRAARRLLLRLHGRFLHLGHAARARGAPVARPAMRVGAQRPRIAFAVPALAGIFLLGQAILDRRAWRLDLTPERRYTLSDQGRKVLDGLPADVHVVAFLRAQDPRNLFIRDLLRQVTARSPRVRVEYLDVNRSPALARQYGVDSYGALVVESEGRRRVFSNPREAGLMAALLQVTRQQRKTVGWVLGHGEGDPNSSDRREGYSTARAVLEQEYYEVRPVSLIGDEVPVETAVLVIAGPRKSFLPEELAVLDRYLQRPGQALVMLDPLHAPELAAHLHQYYVSLPPDVVVDPEARLYGGELLTMQIPFARGDHPILGPLDAPPVFSLTRSVGVLPDDAGATNAVGFLHTSPASWATTDTSVLRTGSPALFAALGLALGAWRRRG